MATKKAAAKKSSKAGAKKPAAKKAAAKKKTAAKKPAAKKKTAAKKTAAKKKAAPKKAAAKRSVARATASARRATAPAAEAPATPEPTTAPEATVAPAPEAPAAPPEPVDLGFPFQLGDPAPDFTLKADDGSTVSLHDLRGKKVVLYFYPRDNTPGCTIEARDFSQLLPEFEAKNAVVLGVSTDDDESHRHFKQTCELSVKLLADADKAAHTAYATWREKNNYGRTYWGTVRTTFLIDEEGRVARIWPKVRVEDHALDVLNAL